MPSFYTKGFQVSWLMFSLPIAIGGLWIAYFLWRLSSRPLLPVRATGIEEIWHAKE
jgi:hypothetical protein